MFISGLNRFFARHGRVIFAVFTGAIIISFVLYFAPGFSFFGMMQESQRETDSSAALILGKKVSGNEIRSNVDSMVIMEMLRNPWANISREQDTAKALYLTMYLRAAKERSIYADDKEVADFLRAYPLFQKAGKFDASVFDMFVKQYIIPRGFTKLDLDLAVRQQLTIEKLFKEVTSGIIVTPEEIKQAFNIRFEKFKVKAWKFSGDDFAAKVVGDDKLVDAFFNTNAEKYVIPAKFKIKLVRFNYVGYEGKVSIPDEKIKKYYESKKDEFKEKDEVLPLEKVSEKIKKTLVEDETKALALKDAQSFAVDAYQATADQKNHKGIVDVFTSFAEKKNQKVYEIGFFSVEDPVIKNVGREPELAMAAAALFKDQPVSDAIQGANACFVACLIEREEPRPAKFDEVKDRVQKDFKKEKSILLSREAARNAALLVSEALDSKKPIPEIANCKIEDMPEFDMMTPPPQSPDAMYIMMLAADTKAGRTSASRETPSGAVLAYVEKRTFPSDQDFKEKEKDFTKSYTSMKTSSERMALDASLMARCKFPSPKKDSDNQPAKTK
ncbi:MAG: peptidyl-prolyl cis-trans isomerase [Victivallales bacterium]